MVEMNKLFEIHNLRCSYDDNYREGVSKVVLNIEELIIPKGKMIFIVGESGIGKSTVLEVLGLMNNTIVPNKDTRFVFYGDEGELDCLRLWNNNDDAELSAVRKKHFNFIFQSTNLMKNFTAYENIAITRMLQGHDKESSFAKAASVMDELGLGHIDRNRMAQELSGGQQQRLAFARAIIPDFTVLLGDEPTGNLDTDNATKAMMMLRSKLSELDGRSAIIVSHDMNLAVKFADVIIRIEKQVDKSALSAGECRFYGMINKESVYIPDEVKEQWTNGKRNFLVGEFVNFLKYGDE
jgi:ABC-type lipoprotein export system ATPase subunit